MFKVTIGLYGVLCVGPKYITDKEYKIVNKWLDYDEWNKVNQRRALANTLTCLSSTNTGHQGIHEQFKIVNM